MSIELEAYLLWERAGRPEGKADLFWYLAEKKEMFKGKSIREVSKLTKVPRSTIQDRLKRGLSLEEAIK